MSITRKSKGNQLEIVVHEKDEINILIAVINLGLITANKSNLLTCDDAEERLYNPHSLKKLQELNVDSELIQMTEVGMMELDALRELNPKAYLKCLEELKISGSIVLKSFFPKKPPTWREWIQ